MHKPTTCTCLASMEPVAWIRPHPAILLGKWQLAFGMALLVSWTAPALTITDDFTNPAAWDAPLTSGPTANLSFGNHRLNYTATTTNDSGAGIPRLEPLLPTTRDWSLQVDVHVDAFPLTTYGQFIDVFLGFGKTGDLLNNHVTFEFDRGWWSGGPGYDINGDLRINGVDTANVFTVRNLTSPDGALRLIYSAAGQSLAYYFDSDGAANGYQWLAQGTAPLAYGTYDLGLSEQDTCTILLLGSSEHQIVATGQAYLSNLVISVTDEMSFSACKPVADFAEPEMAGCSAFDGTNFLVGLSGYIGNEFAVGAQLLSPAGDRIGAFINTGHNTEPYMNAPQVAFGVTNYLLVWTDAGVQHPASGQDVYGQIISRAGSLVGGAFPITASAVDEYATGLAFDGTNFLVIWSAPSGLHGRRLSLSGQAQGDMLTFTTEDVQEAGAVTFGGGQYLVAWVQGTDGAQATRGRFVSPAGQLGTVLLLSDTDSYHFNPVSLAYGADRFLAVWHHNADADADWDLHGRIVQPDGALDGGELVVAAGAGNEVAWAHNAVFDGQQFLIVWAEDTALVRGRYCDLQGQWVGPAFLVDDQPLPELGLGLSHGAGKVLAVFNTNPYSVDGDVCAKFITRRGLALSPQSPAGARLSYAGTLQSSTNLTTWTDVWPQPVSPWSLPTTAGALFFRTR